MEAQSALLERLERLNEELNHTSEELRHRREQTTALTGQNQHLASQMDALTELLAQRDAKIGRLESRLNELLRRIYGRKSERLDPGQLLMQEILLSAEGAAPKPAEEAVSSEQEAIQTTTVREHSRQRRKRVKLPEHLERVNHELDIPAQEKKCGCCGQEMARIGEDTTEKLEYQPLQLKVNRYIRPKYACKNETCEGSGVRQAEAAAGPLGRCEAESSLLAHIIVEKFEHHNPLYRQQIRFERMGVALLRMRMSQWLAKCAYTLEPLYRLMREKILSYDIVLNDDTPVEMLEPGNGKTRTTRLWCSVGAEQLRYILYNFTRSRSREGPEEFFKGYKGFLVCDGYGGYSPLFGRREIIHCGCWAHARRYFVKAQESNPRQATEMLVLIAQLYRIEDKYKHAAREERLKGRQKESVKALEKIKLVLQEHKAQYLPRSALGEAIDYTLRQWEALIRYATDGRLPIDNNLAEQAIRPVALGRKNWLFVGSENGGHTAAVLMSFCATCRKLKIDTWEYLRDVLERINDCRMSQLENLLPDNWQRLRAKNKKI
jgi:transposase